MKKSLAITLAAAVCCCLTSSVFAGPPVPGEIQISYAAGQVSLRWSGDDYWLQSSCTLFPSSWLNVSNMPTLSGGSEVLILPASESVQFFRLIFSPYLPPATELGLEPEEDDAGDTWFALWWDAVPLAVSYDLYYASESTVTQSNYASLPNGGVLQGITNNYATVSNLIAGLQYYFVVTAASTSGQSIDSFATSGMFGQFGDVWGTAHTLMMGGGIAFDEEVPGVTVTLSNLNQPQLSSQTVSDADGNYGFSRQPAGTYQLCWSAPGFVSGCLSDMIVVTNQPVDGEDLLLTNDGSGLVFGHVALADESVAAQTDPFFGIQESVVVSLGLAGQAPLQTAVVDNSGNYLMAGLPFQNGLTLTASNGKVGTSTNIDLKGIEEVDLALPETPPGISYFFATSNGVLITQALQGTELLVMVAATNASGNSDGLHYQWVPGSETTNFASVDSPMVNWTLPSVAGIQTMYVVVSDEGGGYATERLDVSTDLGLLFGGQVVDTNDVPVVGASVSLNGLTTNSDSGGDFSFLVTNLTNIYTVVATLPGYVPCTLMFNDEYQNVQCVMVPEPPCQTFNSTADIYTYDAAQSELIIYSNSLVTASGGEPQQPVCLTLDTLSPCGMAAQLSLSSIGLLGGTNVELEFLAVATVEVYDATGAPLLALTNLPMDFNLAADTNCIDYLTNEVPSFWWYDEIAGVWIPAGPAAASTTLSGKPAFNGRPPPPPPMPMPGPAIIGAGKVAPPIIVPAPVPVPIPIPPPPPPLETFLLVVDETISLPVNVRILDSGTGALVSQATVVKRRETVTVPRSALTLQVISPKEDPEVYPPIPLEANKTVIAQMMTPANLANNSSVFLSLSNQNPNLPDKRVNGSQQFLTFKFEQGSNSLAVRYYNAVDPTRKKDTFAGWKTANGFGAGDTASATFFNAGDLGFGRSMHLKTTANNAAGGNDVAFYVSNYRTASDAITNKNRGLIATVAMDYVANPQNMNKRITAFYVFDKTGNRVNFADLDGHGNKFVPNLCMVCHGGDPDALKDLAKNANKFGDMKAHFLPFDSDSYTYSDQPNQGPMNQTAGFLALNQAIANNTDPTSTTLALIQGWYGANLNNAFNGAFVPMGWMNIPANANIQPAYSGAFAISCRSCHVARDGASAAFPTFTDLNNDANCVTALVYDLPKKVQPMPNALRTFTIFWGSENANVKGLNAKPPPDQTDLLQKALNLGLNNMNQRPAAP